MLLLIQARHTTYPAYKDGISIIDVYLAPVFNVEIAITKAATPMSKGSTMCQNRSPVLSACHAFKRVVSTANTYGGVVRRRVSMVPYFRVWTTVGKKLVTPPADTIPVNIIVSTHTRTSFKARTKPWKKVCSEELFQSSLQTSSFNLHTANWRSSSLSHVVVRGKLGRMKIATNAITIVIAPSIMNNHRLVMF